MSAAALAAEAARIAALHPERAVTPHAIVPIYVRRPDAELARGVRAHAEPRPDDVMTGSGPIRTTSSSSG